MQLKESTYTVSPLSAKLELGLWIVSCGYYSSLHWKKARGGSVAQCLHHRGPRCTEHTTGYILLLHWVSFSHQPASGVRRPPVAVFRNIFDLIFTSEIVKPKSEVRVQSPEVKTKRTWADTKITWAKLWQFKEGNRLRNFSKLKIAFLCSTLVSQAQCGVLQKFKNLEQSEGSALAISQF